MARRGSFGRLPRTQPSVANTLAAIAREYQRQRDQNLMDAWEKGGTFEGQKATDELVLKHWRNRMKNVDKNDPLHDTYKNTVLQYEYAIAESKMATAYAQEKVTDLEMAAFYKKWAAKVPKNSEFWRVLQRDAAQFLRAAKAKAKASSAKVDEEAYKANQLATQRKYERAGDYITEVFRGIAQGNALVGVTSDLSEFDPRDPGAMTRFINAMSNMYGTDDNVLYTDMAGKPVTIGDVRANLTKVDSSFDGRINLNYISDMLDEKMRGVAIRLKRAEQTGHATDTNNLRQEQTYYAELGRQVAMWPVATSYQHARDGFLGVWENPTASPLEKLAAWESYAAKLTSYANTPDLDQNTKARLLAEVEGDASVQSMAESFTGLESANTTTTGSGRTGDIAATHASLAQLVMERDAVETNPGMVLWTTGVRDEQGVFSPQPGGPVIGAATIQQINNVSPVPAVAMMVPQGQGQQPVTIMVTGANVDTGITRTLAGEPVETSGRQIVGQVYDVTIGNFKVRTYAFQAADGKTYYSTEPPWGDNVRFQETKAGISLDLSPFVPTYNAETKKWVHADGSEAALGQNGIGQTAPDSKGNTKVVIDPLVLALSTDPARAKAGIDPTTDFFSPTLAALMSLPRGSETLNQLKDNRQFKALLEYDAYRAAGFAQDPATGAWVPGSGDDTLLSRYQTQAALATSLPDADTMHSFVRDAFGLFLRTTTMGTFDFGTKQAPTGPAPLPSMGGFSPINPPQLASDAARGTDFDPLAQAWQAGTNMLRQLTGQQGGPQIKFANQFTLPSMGGFNPVAPPKPTATNVKPTTTTVNPTVPAVTTTAMNPRVSAPVSSQASSGSFVWVNGRKVYL